MRNTLKTLAQCGLMIAAPSLMHAQAPGGGAAAGGPAGPRGRGPEAGVTQILNARRALELTARQVVQLDSIERVLHTEREKLMAQARPERDAMQAEMRQRVERGERPGQNPAVRDSLHREMRQRMERVRPQMEALRQRDSTSRVAAERILTDAQRTKVHEMQAERRGYERGRLEAEMRGGRQNGMRQGGRPGTMHRGMMPGRGPEGPGGPPRRPE